MLSAIGRFPYYSIFHRKNKNEIKIPEVNAKQTGSFKLHFFLLSCLLFRRKKNVSQSIVEHTSFHRHSFHTFFFFEYSTRNTLTTACRYRQKKQQKMIHFFRFEFYMVFPLSDPYIYVMVSVTNEKLV